MTRPGSERLVSTRGGGAVTAARAVLTGPAPDGGLYAPEYLPYLSLGAIEALAGLDYAGRASFILNLLLPAFGAEALSEAAGRAYSRFGGADAAPLRGLSDDRYILELYHGPTLAFKDFALQLLPDLMSQSARLERDSAKRLILAATSGDTGKAALEAFADQPDCAIAVFYPREGVSEAQRLQMITQRGANTLVAAVRGSFDDAQAGVKRLFASEAFRRSARERGYTLTSANSINYGRLAPQIVYYFSAYADLIKRGAINAGRLVHFCVPTGNFGNILAGDYARRIGLPIGKLICASNSNHILTDFFESGVYDARREFLVTSSPAMDILVSSNLERFVFETAGRDAARVSGWMDSLKHNGWFGLDETERAAINSRILSGWTGEDAVREAISRVWKTCRVLIDPHTAVGLDVLERVQPDDGNPAVVVSTASPFKFGKEVARAILSGVPEGASDFDCCRMVAEEAGVEVPPSIEELPGLPVRHKHRCEPSGMEEIVAEMIA
ncbi:MAG: threonine synthase [Oscillospiraceae bacterium]|jgi:threonine synthase|nr:threonine synthase [Oscillospiraceae bacterium]